MSYNGKTPPVDLFADLEMLGWKPPAVAPPPKIAIDWDTPDEVTGARFTVRDYLVEGAVVEPPAGSGPRGSWAPGERTLLLAPLDRVLVRHDVHVVDRIGGLERRASAPTLPPPPAPTVASAAAPSPAATGPEPVVPSGWAARDLPEGTTVLVEALPPPPQIAVLDRQLTDLDVGVSFTTEEYTAHQSFRGSSVPTTAIRCRLTALVPPAMMDEVLAILATSGVEAEVRILTPDESEAMLADATEEDSDEQALVQASHPCVHIIVDPPMVEAVTDEIARLGLLSWQRVSAEIRSVGVFRGSQNITVRPAAGFEIWVPPAHVDAVAQQLASVARVDANNPDRCWITDPEPPDPEPAAAEETMAAMEAPVLDAPEPTPPPARAAALPATDRVPSGNRDRVLTQR